MKDIESPIFLVASVRSGTTLLGLMLRHHPDIAFPGEFEFAVDLIEENGDLPDVERYHEWLRYDRHFLWHALEIDPSLNFSDLVRSLLAQMKSEDDGTAKPHVGVAVHRNFEHLPSLWPRARYIHLLRDPRDVGASIVEQGWAGNHYVGGRRWREIEEAWTRLRGQIEDDQWIELRFEDLAANPRGELSRLCDFIGVSYRDQMLQYPEHSTYGPVDPSVIHRWRVSQTRRQIRLGEAGAGPLLERRGYSPSGHPRLRIGRVGRPLLRLHGRITTLRWRIRRYGLRLWLERRIADALGATQWQNDVKLREHEITNRHMK